jgi:hypothetical protein
MGSGVEGRAVGPKIYACNIYPHNPFPLSRAEPLYDQAFIAAQIMLQRGNLV